MIAPIAWVLALAGSFIRLCFGFLIRLLDKQGDLAADSPSRVFNGSKIAGGAAQNSSLSLGHFLSGRGKKKGKKILTTWRFGVPGVRDIL